MIAGIQLVEVLSDLVEGRIYPDFATEYDDQTAPYIIYQDITNTPENTMDGFIGHEWVRMQIDVYHCDKHQSILLANRIIDQIKRNINPAVFGGKHTASSGSKLYRQLIEYEFWQTAPID